jgi:hypothetical protein
MIRSTRPKDFNAYGLLRLWHRIRQPRHVVPRCGTPAAVVVTRRVGLFALACLHIARVAALLDVLAALWCLRTAMISWQRSW